MAQYFHTTRHDLDNLERENACLHRAVEELSVLNELATEIGSAGSVDNILQTVIRRARRAVAAAEGVITLVGDQTEASMHTLVRTREHTSAAAA